MGFRLNYISISNFRYIPPQVSQIMSFENSNLTILEGPNGYGKSTLFDAIELLITGELHRLKRDLLNRGKIDNSVLAHDKQKDIVIQGEFVDSKNHSTLKIKRVLGTDSSSLNQLSQQTVGGEFVYMEQSDLFDRLGITAQTFHLSVYISQSDSLRFMTQKYAERKIQLSSVLGDDSSEEKLNGLKVFRDEFKKQRDSWIKAQDEALLNLKRTKDHLQDQVEELKATGSTPSYKRLFEKEYAFDREDVYVKEVDFAQMVEPLRHLQAFLENQESFRSELSNRKLE